MNLTLKFLLHVVIQTQTLMSDSCYSIPFYLLQKVRTSIAYVQLILYDTLGIFSEPHIRVIVSYIDTAYQKVVFCIALWLPVYLQVNIVAVLYVRGRSLYYYLSKSRLRLR